MLLWLAEAYNNEVIILVLVLEANFLKGFTTRIKVDDRIIRFAAVLMCNTNEDTVVSQE